MSAGKSPVSVGGAKPSTKAPVASSSDSDSSDDEVPVVSKKPAIVKPSTPSSKGVIGGVVGVSASGVKSQAKRGAQPSSSDSDSSDDGVSAVATKKPASLVTRKSRLSSGDDLVACGRVPCRRRAFAPFPAGVGTGVERPPLKRNKGNSGDGRRNSVPFRGVTEDSVRLDPRLADNSFDAKLKAQGS
ncbi:unnamed protein product [Echinostoma caproni]|uniref:Uncharacterized protein n=1 Tax=Echinostoma caproni TaxID=27848 RepID=A0A3P8GU92_9TREM|nr:unnamed protein product [Echinostoma caproni]